MRLSTRMAVVILMAMLYMQCVQLTARAQEPVILTDRSDVCPVGPHLEILEDEAGEWTIEDVTSPALASRFEPFQGETPSFGFTDSAYWLRARVTNRAESISDWLLRLDGWLFYVDFYLPHAEGKTYRVVRTGTIRPFGSREIPHPSYLFDLDLEPGETQTIYLRLKSEGSVIAPLSIMSQAQVWQMDLVERSATGVVLGALAIMAAYNLILFLYLRDRTYLFFALFLASNVMLYLWFGGISHWLFWPASGRFNAVAGQFFFVLAMIFMLAFADSFVLGSERSKRLRAASRGFASAFAVVLPFILFINIGITARIVIVLTIASYLLVVYTGYTVWRGGYRPARFFVLAWVVWLTYIVVFTLALLSLVPASLVSVLGGAVGVLILALALSLALADRISLLRGEAATAQAQIVVQQQEAIRMKDDFAAELQKANEDLEERIAQRTSELAFVRKQLNALFEHSPLGIGFASADGNVLSANAAMAEMLGYSLEEIFECNVSDFFVSREARNQVLSRLETEGTVQITPLELRRKDGTPFLVTLTESRLAIGNQTVLLGVLNDITDRIRAEEVERTAAEQAAVAEERNRIAREMHDSVTQALYTTSLIAEALPVVWEIRPDEAKRSLEDLRVLTQGALGEMRTLLLELRPGEFADRSLGDLFRQLTEALSARTTMPISMSETGTCSPPTEVQVAMYRIGQEALNNIVKHARAEHAWVNVNCTDDGVTLTVRDDGRGFNAASRPDSMGIKIMNERAQKAAIDLTIDSAPDEGTIVRASWYALRASDGQ